MSGIAWNLLQPVDTGSLVQQGFGTGMALVKGIQTRSALGSYLANPDDPQAFGALAYLDPQAAQSAQQQHLFRQKMIAQQQAQERAQQLGSLAVEDPSAARAEAMRSGDFDLAKTFGELDEAQQKKTADFWGMAGSAAFTLKNERDPAKRQALWSEMRPMLAAQGAPAEMLDQFDPLNETQIDAAIATSQKVGDLITQSRVTWHQQGEQPSFATDYMGRPVGSQNPYRQGAPVPAAGDADTAWQANVQQESGGKPGVRGQPTQYGTAIGATQMLPETAQAMAQKLGLPWRPDLLEAKTDEGLQYQLTLGRAYWDEGWQKYGGDPYKAALYYHGGPDESRWGPKTHEHARRVVAKMGGTAPQVAVRVNSKAEYDALPAGAPYIAPDGSARRKG